MKQLPKQYDHKAREKFWQDSWAKSDVYHFRDDKPREETFVIDTPPPTVSGVLHMGHIFSYTQADFVARYQRMSGKDVFYPMGFDDNGLPTERLVEKIKEKKAGQYPSREAFVADCREVVKSAEEEFRALFKSAALSVDWGLEYQTISDEVRKLSQASFLDLLKRGEAYRDFRPTYWDWVDQTAIAQAEIENKELPGVMNEIEFTLEDGAPLVIATTRPELLGACVAVMYHPEDPNAAKYEGKTAVTPLFGVKVPMIADEAVDKEFGSGVVMCCTFGDDTDKEWWRKYKLPLRVILSSQGKINFNAFNFVKSLSNEELNRCFWDNEKVQSLRDLKPKQANIKIIELLKAEGKLLKQAQITHTVKCAERSGTPIEIIATYQWFIKITDKKEALMQKGAECNWYPDFMRIRLNQWIEGLKEDWCVSRQRFFGVPFPVWYSIKKSDDFQIIVAPDEMLPIDPIQQFPYFAFNEKDYDIKFVESLNGWTVINKTNSEDRHLVVPCLDVMDTWATSSLTPEINAKSLAPNKLFPADLRPQAHEIIRTWAFYTIVKAHLHGNTIPWKNLMISGWCLAADKSKMSKSKGNVVTPVALIEEKGSDAVRYWASTSRLGTDTAFSEDLLKIGKKLVTKLWNASNFASLNLSNLSGIPSTPTRDTQAGHISEPLDLWILSRLNQCIKKATQEFERFEYCDARVAIEDFFWNDFCDNYLELVKARSYGEENKMDSRLRGNDEKKKQQSALYTIYHCLETLLRLFAPFVPHITEELYSHIFDERYGKTGSVHARGQWPRAEDYPYDEAAELSGMACVDVLNVIRKAKSKAGVSIKFPVTLVEIKVESMEGASTSVPYWPHIESLLHDLKTAANAETIVESQKSELPYLSDRGFFRVGVTLAKTEEQKRSPDHDEKHVLEGKVIHGPGNPDLSRHVVKVQVDSLPDTLERHK